MVVWECIYLLQSSSGWMQRQVCSRIWKVTISDLFIGGFLDSQCQWQWFQCWKIWYFQILTSIFWYFLFVVQGRLWYISFCGPIFQTQGTALAGKTIPMSYTISFVILREYLKEKKIYIAQNCYKTVIHLPLIPKCLVYGDEAPHL